MPTVNAKRRGRPRGENRARTQAAKTFFEAIDRLGLSYSDVIAAIAAKHEEAPKYRTLQDWRRGVNLPKLMPFEAWTETMSLYATRARHRRSP